MVERLLEYTRGERITTLLTGLSSANELPVTRSRLNISTLVETWITLSCNAVRGERNRALSIVKMRGMNPSSQVCELVLRSRGPALADVCTQAGEVLSDTASLEQEQTVADAAGQACRGASL